MLLNNRDLGIRAAPQNEKRKIRFCEFFFFFASWYQLANLAGRPIPKKKSRNFFVFRFLFLSF
ncbi:hypothetical protein HMPREF1376_00084 [Enterococcus faecium R446]|nr:hypothetical protein HMPREF1376_00084 [Enterococcus faecium R446]